MIPNPTLKHFLHALDGEQQERFAAAAGTTVGAIRHMVTGRRGVSAGMAIALEKSAKRLGAGRKYPLLLRTDLSLACKHCEYAKACAKLAAAKAKVTKAVETL